MPLATLQRRSVVDQAFELLRAQILHGTWAPGAKLPTEAVLTRDLGVSRSTVREALNRLASAGLVAIPHGGTKTVRDYREHAGLEVLSALVVTPQGGVAPRVVRSVVEMRDAIAPDVARLAAGRATLEQSDDLVQRAEALDPSADLETLLVETLEWWTALVLASDNLAYRLAYNTLRSTYSEGRPMLRELLAAELRATDLYVRISLAVRTGDSVRAADDCRTLVARGSSVLFQALDALPGA